MARIHNRQSAICNAGATGGKNEQTICNIRGYHFNVRTHKALLEKLDYCHKNPLTIIFSHTSKGGWAPGQWWSWRHPGQSRLARRDK